MNAHEPDKSSSTRHRIVIVGGGAGGLVLATRLGDSLGKKGKAEVTLVDRHATHVWKPLLHEVAAGRIDSDAHGLDYLALAHWHHFKFRQGAVDGVDRIRKQLTLSAVIDDDGSEMLPRRTLHYDTLVICVGSVSNDFGVQGVTEHAISLDSLPEAERFHRRLLAACVRADSAAAEGKPGQVNIVIIGAGATGVELAAEIRACTKTHVAYGLDHLIPERDIRLTLIEAAPRILPPLPQHVAIAATRLLEKLSVTVLTGQGVTSVAPGLVRVGEGSEIPADLVVWAAGIMAPEWLTQLDGLETNRSHQLVVGPTLQTTRDPAIFAFGDCAACRWIGAPKGVKAGALVPPRAQAAHQQASLLAKSLPRRMEGKPLKTFKFHDLGSLVSLGELSAVGTLMGRLLGGSLFIQGLIARWMYASLYKMHQLSIHGFWRVAMETVGRFLRRRTEPRVKLH